MFRKPLLAVIAAIALFTVFLSACGGGTTEEKIYNHLEEAVALEADFEKRQEQLIKLEKKEQEIYGEIMELGADDLDEIKKTSKKAIEIIDERTDEMKAEKESIDNSQAEFEKTDKLIDKLEDEEVQKKGREMYDVMMERYDTYDQLYDAYTESLNSEEDLYKMLQKEDIEQEEVTEQIKKINKSYEKVLESNEKFNEQTNKYNEMKKTFYDAAEINVNYDGNNNDKDEEADNKEDKE